MKLFWYLVTSFIIWVVEAVPVIPLETRSSLIPPSDDPFYNPPVGFEKEPLGAILRQRRNDHSYGFLFLPQNIEAAYQFLVRSEDSFGEPIGVVTTLFVPHNADPTKLLSYQVAEDSSYKNCAPSYAMQNGAPLSTIVTPQLEGFLTQAGLNQGWYVVVPDHEGPKSTYVAGYSAGKAVLNSIRAVLSSGNDTGIDPDAEVALWGYSGGSLGTGWGAQLHPTYAPELNLIGAAYGGIIVNVSSVAKYNLGKATAGLVFSAINGLTNEYPELNTYVNENVFPSKLKKFRKPQSECLIQYVLPFAFNDLKDYIPEGDNVFNTDLVRNISDHNNMLLNGMIPDIPIFLYNSKNDEIVPPGDTDDLYEHFCSQGVSVEYRQDRFSEHISTQVVGSGWAFEWIRERFNGTAPVSKCVKTTVFTSLTEPLNLAGLEYIAGHALDTLKGEPVGPGQGTTS
ncbi:lipase 1 [[Candida] anglica]|uniref:Lipase 1 n=1 Tax=[Candida] anglica TaxID=148631 RepID=A0ABP0EJC9_9ASCO